MKRSRFKEEQIIAILREQEAGSPTADVCRKHGISSGTFYKWKAKFGGMDVSDAKRLKALEDENAKLKKLLAEQMLDASALRELLAKKLGRQSRLSGRMKQWGSSVPDGRCGMTRTSGRLPPDRER